MLRPDRRSTLAAVLAAGVLSSCSTPRPAPSRPTTSPTPTNTVEPSTIRPEPRRPTSVDVEPGVIDSVPAAGRQLALTVDDGVDPEVVAGYADLCRRTGLRMTFFANGIYDSWRAVGPVLAPMVDSGQVQIANHTFDHPDLRSLSDRQIADQVQRNDAALRKIFGRSTAPYVRPPYGFHDARVREVLAAEGYSLVCMWYGTLGDDQDISAHQIMVNARQWLKPGQLVIGHANHSGTTDALERFHRLIEDRRLRTVTLAETVKPR